MRITFAHPPVGRLVASGVAGGFMVTGLLFLFFSLPHSEVLRCERAGAAVLCSSRELLLGRWTWTESWTRAGPGSHARVAAQSIDGDSTFHGMIDGPAGRLYYGESNPRPEVQAGVDRINRFLADPAAPAVEVRENVWWWFAAPFGLLAIGMGALALAAVNATARWTMDRRRSEIRCVSRTLLVRRGRAWPLAALAGAEVTRETDAEGDVWLNVALRFRSGERVLMSPAPVPRAWEPRVHALAGLVHHQAWPGAASAAGGVLAGGGAGR